MSVEHCLRSMRAERIRTGGRSRLWTALVPASAGVPMILTFGIAAVAEAFARIPGQLSILQVPTSNAAYWVITITVVLVSVAAADGQASESRYRTNEYIRLAIPGRLPALAGKWWFYGLLGGLVTALTMVAVLVVLPIISPRVYGSVSIGDTVGLRLLWTVPLFAFFAAGAGVGVGGLLRSPLGAGGVILLWAYVVETAAGYLPNGASLQRFMPLLNMVFATGQDTVLRPPWGQDVALLYVCALFSAVFAAAVIQGSIRK